jgi:hypothetical protein
VTNAAQYLAKKEPILLEKVNVKLASIALA